MIYLVSAVVLAAAGLAAVWVYRHFPVLAIIRSKTHLEQAFDSFDDPLAAIDTEYRILRINRAYASLVGRPYTSILGKPCHKVLRKRDTPCRDCRMKEALEEHARTIVERSPHPKRRRGATITLTFFPFGTAATRTEPAILEHIRDTTELERLRDRLEEKNRELERTAHQLQTAQHALYAEIDMAREVQQCILPRSIPSYAPLRIDVTYQPIESVGGDFYDFIRFPGDKLGVFIGDASGHGLPASFVSTMAKMALYHHTREELEPDQLLYRVNHDLIENVHTSHYLTCFWCIFDPATRRLTYSRGGHPRPIVVRADGEVIELEAPGTLLGLLSDSTYSKNAFACKPGDRIVLFTDGAYMTKYEGDVVLPAYNASQFRSVVAECTRGRFEDVLPGIRERLSQYACEDDYTLLVMDVL